MDEFKDQVRKGFSKCKTDIDAIEAENFELKTKVKTLNDEVIELKAQVKGINIALDYIKEFNKTIHTNTTSQRVIEDETPTVEKIIQSAPISTPKKTISQQDPYEALLAFKARANKREILKQKLVSMVGESGINLSELKFLFVEHYKYCSKATYYNYLKELELEKVIKIERENTKNYIYLNNSIRNVL